MKPVITLIIVLMLISCSDDKKNAQNGTENRQQKPRVQVATIVEREVADLLKLYGEVKPLYKIQVFSKVNGVVEEEKVREGDPVRENQELAKVVQDIPGMNFSPVAVTATNSGIITRDFVHKGSRVNIQQPMYEISYLDQVYFETNVMETHLSELKPGAQVKVYLDAFGDKTHTGRIKEIGTEINPQNRTVRLRILLPNSGLKIKPGMYGFAEVRTTAHTALVVPVDALLRRGLKYTVFTVRNGFAGETMVEAGTLLNEFIEIKGDIKAGDLVVVRGQNMLEDGMAVEIIREKRL